MIKKNIITTIIFIAISNFCFAEEVITNDTTYDKRVSVYLHPGSLIFSGGELIESKNRFNNRKSDIALYLTVEVPLSLSYSLIIRPSYWYDGRSSFIDFVPIDRKGSDIGIRFFPSEKGKDFYLQGQTGLFFCSDKDSYYGKKENYMWFDVMGYIGYSAKFSNFRLFFDVGYGYSIKNTRKLPNEFTIWRDNSAIPDINFGIGFALEKNK